MYRTTLAIAFATIGLTAHPMGVFAQPAAQPACPPASAEACGPLPSDTTETNRGPIVPFLEGTDVFWTIAAADRTKSFPYDSKKFFPYRLEADIFPHLVVYQNFTDVLDVRKQAKRGLGNLKEFAWSFSGTPAVRIRMLPLTSAPVRTPSFMPRGNIQMLWVRGLKNNAEQALRNKADDKPTQAYLATQRQAAPESAGQSEVLVALANLTRVSVWETHLIIGHHSNGQERCLSTAQHREPPEDGPCVPEVTLTAATINRVDGSFSTNYLRWGVNYSWNRLKPVEPPAGAASGGAAGIPRESKAVEERRVRAEIEWHPYPWVDDDMVDLYGRLRLNVGAAWARQLPRVCKKRGEVSAGLTWNPQVDDSVPEVSYMLQGSCFLTLNGGWGFFLRLYQGQDYYNVGFLDNIVRLHAGLTFNPTGFFRFRRAVAERTP